MSVVDANLPIFHLLPTRANPTSESIIAHSQNGSPPSPQYLKRRDPTHSDTYSISLRDAHYPEITYASCSTKAIYPSPTSTTSSNKKRSGKDSSGGGSGRPNTPPEPDPPKVPAAITVTLFNPTLRVLLTQKPSSWNSGPYWEFSIPKSSFLQPTGSKLDQTVGQVRVASGTVPMATFRWRKEGGMLSKSSLRCSLIHPNNVLAHDDGTGGGGRKLSAGGGGANGGGGTKEPDITVAIFTNGISGGKPGKGEITIFEPSLKRVEIEDLKGLEVMLIMSAMVIADVWFSDMRVMFNLTPERIPNSFSGPGRTATFTVQQMAELTREDERIEEEERQRRSQLLASTPYVLSDEALPAYVGPANGALPPEKQRPTQAQLLNPEYQQRLVEHQRHQELEAQRLSLERRRQQQEQQRLDIERERLRQEAEAEAVAKRLQQQFDEEARRERERVDAETARLRAEFERERQQLARRNGISPGVMAARPFTQPLTRERPPAMPPRPPVQQQHHHHQQGYFPPQIQHPYQGHQGHQHHTLHVKKSSWFGGGDGGKKLDGKKDRRKSFMGLRIFGEGNGAGGSGGLSEQQRKGQKKLAKKKSGMW